MYASKHSPENIEGRNQEHQDLPDSSVAQYQMFVEKLVPTNKYDSGVQKHQVLDDGVLELSRYNSMHYSDIHHKHLPTTSASPYNSVLNCHLTAVIQMLLLYRYITVLSSSL